MAHKNAGAKFYRLLALREKEILGEFLLAWRWNRKAAARDLGISYRSLLLKIKQHGLHK